MTIVEQIIMAGATIRPYHNTVLLGMIIRMTWASLSRLLHSSWVCAQIRALRFRSLYAGRASVVFTDRGHGGKCGEASILCDTELRGFVVVWAALAHVCMRACMRQADVYEAYFEDTELAMEMIHKFDRDVRCSLVVATAMAS